MKVSCPACSAKYSIADDKVTGRLAKIRCRKCGTTIVIDGKVDPPHVFAAEADAAASVSMPPDGGAETYSVDLGGGEPRNMTLAEIAAGYAAGQITAETFVWADGFADWKPVSDVPELASAVQGAPAARNAPWDGGAAKKAAAEAPRVAAKAKPARGGAGDLFGGYAQAGSEEDVTTSAPQQQQQHAAPAADPQGGLTGARNESSVLFSLSALTASSPSNPPPPAVAAAGDDEDSGLIDLKALTSSPGDSGLAASPLVAPLGIAPLGMGMGMGMGAPFGGTTESPAIAVPDYPQQKPKTGLYVVGGLIAAAAIVAVAIIVTTGGKPEPTAAAQPSVMVVEKIVERTVEKPSEDAKPPSTGVTEDEAADAGPKTAAATKPRYTGGTAAKKSTGTSSGTTSGTSGGTTTSTEAAPKKKKKGCSCDPSDFDCQLRCRAK